MGQDDLTAWDDRKNELNIQRHGIDLSALKNVFDGRSVLVREDLRRDYGEQRFNMLVEINGIVLNVTFTPRGGKQRIMSARLANRRERRLYEQKGH